MDSTTPTRFTPEYSAPLYQPQFNYECPDCKGKFMTPARDMMTATGNPRCPFCGREMKGLI